MKGNKRAVVKRKQTLNMKKLDLEELEFIEIICFTDNVSEVLLVKR